MTSNVGAGNPDAPGGAEEISPRRGPSAVRVEAASGAESPEIGEVERSFTSLCRAIVKLKSKRSVGSASDDLDRTTYFALIALDEFGLMRVCELAPILGLDTSTVSRLVGQLDEAGLVERTRDANDRRAQLIQASDKGREVLRDASVARRQMLGEAMALWEADDCRKMADLMKRLAEALVDSADRSS